MAKRVRGGPPSSVRAKVVAKIRRNKVEAYGSRSDWTIICRRVKNRDGNRCRKCLSTEFLQVDHIIPVSKGGRTVESNLWTLCAFCHSKRPGHRRAKSLILHKTKTKV